MGSRSKGFRDVLEKRKLQITTTANVDIIAAVNNINAK